jgi:transcriptional regulator with XRE-family HTH domain
MALGQTLRKARQEKKLTASEVAAGTRMKVQMVEALEREDFSQVAATIYGKGFIRMYADYVRLDPEPLIREYMERFVEPSHDAPQTVSAPSDIFEDEESEGLFWWWPWGGSEEEEEKAEPAAVAPSAPVAMSKETDVVAEEETDAVEEEETKEADLFSHIRVPKETLEATSEEEDEPLIDLSAIGDAVDNVRTKCSEVIGAIGDSIGSVTRGIRDKASSIEISLPEIKVPDSNFKSIPLVVLSVIIVIFMISGLSRCARDKKSGEGTAIVTEDPALLLLAVESDEPYVD